MAESNDTAREEKAKMRALWDQAAPRWIERIRTRGDISREGLLDEWMLRALGDVSGARIIDLGCGEGRFSRMLAQRGANVTGVELSAPMLRAALEARVKDETYLPADMENLSAIQDAHFDIAVAYLTLLDVLDYQSAIREAFRILRPGGRFIVCNLAPMVTAGNMWVKYGDGTKLHFRLDNYLDETVREMPMCGVNIRNFHRTLSSYLNGFIESGFVLERIEEPVPSPEQLAAFPDNDDMLRVPLFIIYLLRKPL
jgi:SAM-dependent methyltransferase